jgi:hypothetical protein
MMQPGDGSDYPGHAAPASSAGRERQSLFAPLLLSGLSDTRRKQDWRNLGISQC